MKMACPFPAFTFPRQMAQALVEGLVLKVLEKREKEPPEERETGDREFESAVDVTERL